MTWLARLVRHTTFSPQRLSLFWKAWMLYRGHDRSLNLNLCFLSTRGVINTTGVVWDAQCLSLCRVCTWASLFNSATINSVYKSCVSMAAASTL